MQTVYDALRDASLQSLQQDYLRCAQADWDEGSAVSLPQATLADLAGRIAALPLVYRSVLYFRYCFGSSPAETESVLQISMAVGKLRYLRELLSESMGFQGVLIDDGTMRAACSLALEGELPAGDFAIKRTRYSQRFCRRLRQVRAAQSVSSTMLLFAKRAAAIILICAISFSTALVANAELRERFFGWVVQVFSTHSVFSPRLDGTASVSGELELGYIPEDFALFERIDMRQGTILIYQDTKGNQITVSVSSSDKAAFAMNTEDATINPIKMGTGDAFWWDKDGEIFVVWQQDGFACDIIADLDIEQVLEVAKNVKIK